MKQRSLKSNYILTIIRIVVSSLAGLLIISYSNKILGASIIGKVEYANTIINYFIMFSSLGIPIYAIREVSKSRDDRHQLTKTVSELLAILSVTSFISYAILFLSIFVFNFFEGYKNVLLVFSVSILLTNLGADWFFQAMENQLYITIRFVFTRILTLIILYSAVHNPQDYVIYTLVIILNTCGSNIFNFIYLIKYLDFKSLRYSELNFKRHFKPILTIFIAAISVNIYLQLDNFLIGTISGDKYLGYYSNANKLIRYSIMVITVSGIVLLPRLSNYWLNNKPEYFKLLNKAYSYIILLAVPFSCFFYVFAFNIIDIMAGKDFYPSIITVKLLSPLCVIIGIAYFLGYMVLIPQKKEKIYTLSVIISAVASVILNLYSIKLWNHNGAAVVQVIVELLAVMLMLYFVRMDLKKIIFFNNNIFKIIAVSIFTSIVFYIFQLDDKINFYGFIAISLAFFIIIYSLLILLKENNTTTIKNILILKLNKTGR